MSKSSVAAAAAVSLALALQGCPGEVHDASNDPEPKPAEATPASNTGAPTPAADAPIELPKITGPVAKVNGVDIPSEQFLSEYKSTLERYRRARHPVRAELKERLKDNLVRRLVDAEIITQRAKALDISLDDKQFAAKWEQHKGRYGSEKAFNDFLQRAGTSEMAVREQFKLNMIREKVFNHISKGIAVSKAETKKFYDDNKQRYFEPEQVRASHILIRVEPNASAEAKEEKRKHAETIRQKARKKGAKFEKLAKEFGEDPTRSRGGDLGFFTRGRMVKAFEDAVWPMRLNELSGVVETNFGYHIIKKTGHKKESQKSFKSVKDQIERAVRARKRNQSIRDALQKWKDEAKLEIFVKGDETIIQQNTPPGGNLKVQPVNQGMPIQRTPPPTTDTRPVK